VRATYNGTDIFVVNGISTAVDVIVQIFDTWGYNGIEYM
jgi:hypothetical protein